MKCASQIYTRGCLRPYSDKAQKRRSDWDNIYGWIDLEFRNYVSQKELCKSANLYFDFSVSNECKWHVCFNWEFLIEVTYNIQICFIGQTQLWCHMSGSGWWHQKHGRLGNIKAIKFSVFPFLCLAGDGLFWAFYPTALIYLLYIITFLFILCSHLIFSIFIIRADAPIIVHSWEYLLTDELYDR